jgi:hypothetical protein
MPSNASLSPNLCTSILGNTCYRKSDPQYPSLRLAVVAAHTHERSILLTCQDQRGHLVTVGIDEVVMDGRW